MKDLITDYLKLSVDFDQDWTNVEYCLRKMLAPLGKIKKSPIAIGFEAAKTLEAFWSVVQIINLFPISHSVSVCDHITVTYLIWANTAEKNNPNISRRACKR